MESEFADMICQKLVECCEDTDPYLQNGECGEIRQNVGQAEYCEICKMWLNGPTQMNDHKGGQTTQAKVKETKKSSNLHFVNGISVFGMLQTFKQGRPVTLLLE